MNRRNLIISPNDSTNGNTACARCDASLRSSILALALLCRSHNSPFSPHALRLLCEACYLLEAEVSDFNDLLPGENPSAEVFITTAFNQPRIIPLLCEILQQE